MNFSNINTAYNKEYNEIWSSPKASKLMSTYGALKILSGAGSESKRDTLTISMEARNYTRDSLVAIVDSGVLPADASLSFYFEHHNDARAILDALNFYDGPTFGGHTASEHVSYEAFGICGIEINGQKQAIPRYAIPKMNPKAYPKLQAKNNTLVLDNRSYYSYTSSSGKSYVCSVYNGEVEKAYTEYVNEREENQTLQDIQDGPEIASVRWVLSGLATGNLYRATCDRTRLILEQVGITEGHFSVEAGAGVHHYALTENGVILDVDNRVKFFNETNWTELGYQEGAVFQIYGNEYVLDSEGHIHVSVEDGFTDTTYKLPDRQNRTVNTANASE